MNDASTHDSATDSILLFQSAAAAGAGTKATALTKVLHVINGEHYSGAERVQDLLAQLLPTFGYEVGFACVKPDRFPQARHYHDARLHLVPMRSRLDLQCVSSLVDLIRQEGYSLVHAHTPRSVMVGAVAAGRADVPLVYHLHSPTANDSTKRLLNFVNHHSERWSLRRAAKIIAVSPSLESRMLHDGFSPGRVCCVTNGVPSAEPCVGGAPDGAWTLGTVALFRPRKGIEVLLEAVAELVSRGADVRLLAVGPFETEAYGHDVFALADRLGIAEHIEWTGFVDDVGEQLRRMDLFLLPSLFGEGLPMVVLEAMAVGLPVVASRVEGIPEAVRHREEGLLVEPGDAGELAAAIDEVVSGRLDYGGLSAAALARHRERFSAEAMAGRVAEVYDEVLGDESA